MLLLKQVILILQQDLRLHLCMASSHSVHHIHERRCHQQTLTALGCVGQARVRLSRQQDSKQRPNNQVEAHCAAGAACSNQPSTALSLHAPGHTIQATAALLLPQSNNSLLYNAHRSASCNVTWPVYKAIFKCKGCTGQSSNHQQQACSTSAATLLAKPKQGMQAMRLVQILLCHPIKPRCPLAHHPGPWQTVT